MVFYISSKALVIRQAMDFGSRLTFLSAMMSGGVSNRSILALVTNHRTKQCESDTIQGSQLTVKIAHIFMVSVYRARKKQQRAI